MKHNERIRKLEAALTQLAKQKAKVEARVITEVSNETVMHVLDILLGVGGPTAWAMAHVDRSGYTSPEVAKLLFTLGFAEVGRESGKIEWVLPSAQAEKQFMSDWLALADHEGRKVERRAAIEAWIGYSPAPPVETHSSPVAVTNDTVVDDAALRSMWGPEERVPYADEVRAQEAREAAKRPATRTQEDVQASLERRRQRLGR